MASSTQAMDTITALATPPGRGGIGVVRVSGPLSSQVALTILGKLPQPRKAEYLPFKDESGETNDIGLAIYFEGPHSFTGEDVLELQGHGGPVVMDLLLKSILSLGVRMARPGEFSERAFLNDKLDLAQAEAIADLIESSSERAARSALRSLQGEFSKRIHKLVDALVKLRMYVESAIDFPEEEIDFLQDSQVKDQLTLIITQLKQTLSEARQGQLLREGMTVVIAGKPNAGKSTLLNQLTGRESAIVTEIPGTT
ncbi:MAG: tRNA modification GTPase, partial [Gammaproteobacteria bacterium]